MKNCLCVVFLLYSFMLTAKGLDEEQKAHVRCFVELVREYRMDDLSSYVDYPLMRKYPLRPIESQGAFRSRHHEFFDQTLIELISSSDVEQDWIAVGSKGIMLHSGAVWLDNDGYLMAVNYHSPEELKDHAKHLETDRLAVHHSLREFDKLVCLFKTKFHFARIDDLGNSFYRLTLWKKKGNMNSLPILVVVTVQNPIQGSAGGQLFEFVSGNEVYHCSIIPEEKLGVVMTVEVNGKIENEYKGEKVFM